MSFFAGILARRAGSSVPAEARAQLRAALSRHPGEEIREVDEAGVYLASADLRALATGAGPVRTGDALTIVAGEPLIAPAGSDLPGDLRRLHEVVRDERWELLSGARGSYCAVQVRMSPSPRITLLVDRIGVRPLYWWADADFAVFATSLRVIEAVGLVPKALDVRAVTEVSTLGFPLADRTPYIGVRALRDSEIVRIDAAEIHRQQYWRWDSIPTSGAEQDELLQASHDVFMEAVGRRSHGDSAAIAFLSGGLDSRAVVSALRSQDVDVLSFCFSRPELQDHALSQAFANAAGTTHSALRLRGRTPIDFVKLMSDALRESPQTGRVERPRVAWSGDGGSVGLGHVYIRPDSAAAMRSGQPAEATRAFLRAQKANFPLRVLHPTLRPTVADVVQAGLLEELADIRSDDPVRRFHLLLMLNDQRRHLFRHFESLDVNRLELQLPFFDGAFIESVIRMPIEMCLYHRAYNRWLKLFPSYATEVPWQSYPGHEPCPLPLPEGLVYQWGRGPYKRTPGERRKLMRRQSRQFFKLLRSPDFPGRVLHRPFLWAAAWVHWAGVRDFRYAFDSAEVFRQYWRHTGDARSA